MKKTAQRNKAIVALKRAIVDTFDEARWQELGYLTDTTDIIEGHERLLRSLYWQDKDYDTNVIVVLARIIDRHEGNLDTVEEIVGLEDWLKQNDPPMYRELYETGGVVSLEQVEIAAAISNIKELNRHAERIRRGIQDDPEQAIGSAKELLESVLKSVLGVEGERGTDDIPGLLRRAQRELDLDPKLVGESVPGGDLIKRTLSNLGQVVINVAELRNLYGTGHGRHRSRSLEVAHARLVVNAAITIATFLLEVADERQQQKE